MKMGSTDENVSFMNLKYECDFSDTSYSSDDDLINKFLHIKSHRSLNPPKNDESFESTKVVEVFITKDGKIFAHCSICLYKTEIKNINYLLKHFMDNHAIRKIVQNTDYLFSICNNINWDDNHFMFENKGKNTEDNKSEINLTDFQLDSNGNKKSEIKTIYVIPPEAYETEILGFENVSDDQSSVSCMDKSIEISKLSTVNTSFNDDFENSLIDIVESESNKKIEYVTADEEEYCDTILLEQEHTADKYDSLDVDTSEEKQTSYIDFSNLKSVQKLDEEFYQQLGGLNPDQSLCQLCNVKFRHISRHYKNQHPEIILCEIGKCFQTFKSLPELGIHKKRFHNDPKHAFSCTICLYKTNNLHSFRFHYQRIHLNIKDFDCDFCDMKFFSNYEKIKHMRSHTGQKPYPCQMCNSKYPTKQQLNLHIQKYHSEPLFDCQICNKKFHRRQTLKEHQMTKHSQNEKKIICEICGDGFFLKKYWREHFNNIHNPDRKRWVCNECGKSFSRNSNLRDHKATHNLKD